MRKKEPCIIITFHTTADAMTIEKFCQEHEIPGRLIPVPRELSAGCGMAFKMTKKNPTDSFLATLHTSGVSFEQIVEMDA